MAFAGINYLAVLIVVVAGFAFGSQRKPMPSVIDGMHCVGVLVMQGAVIAAMGV